MTTSEVGSSGAGDSSTKSRIYDLSRIRLPVDSGRMRLQSHCEAGLARDRGQATMKLYIRIWRKAIVPVEIIHRDGSSNPGAVCSGTALPAVAKRNPLVSSFAAMRAARFGNGWLRVVSRVLALTCMVSATVPGSAQAGSHTWSGAVNGNWSVAGNWSAGGVPIAGESPLQLTFPANVNRYTCTNDVAGLQVDAMTLSGLMYTICGVAGKPLTLKGGTNIVSTDLNTLDTSLALVLQNTNYISVATNKQLTIQSPISGSGSLAKIGAGQLSFTGLPANTYSGATFVLDGALTLQRGASSNNPAVAVPGPLFVGTYKNGDVQTYIEYPQQLGADGIVTMYYSGSLELHAPQTLSSLTFFGGDIFGTSLLTLHGDISGTFSTNGSAINCPVSLGGTNRTINTLYPSGYGLYINASISDGGKSAGL